MLGDSTTCEYARGNDPVETVTVPLVTDDPVSCLMTFTLWRENHISGKSMSFAHALNGRDSHFYPRDLCDLQVYFLPRDMGSQS